MLAFCWHMTNALSPATLQSGALAPVKSSRPLLRVIRETGGEFYHIDKGKQGSYQTAAAMARLVREDTVRDEGLQRFAAQLIIDAGLDSHSPKWDIASAIYNYVKTIRYINDPAGAFDSIQNARTTIAKGFGDCDDLSVLLATLLAQVGITPRFVLARYRAKRDEYDHVYVEARTPGGWMALDPSARRRGPGWESPNAIERFPYPIFGGRAAGLGNVTQMAAVTGAQIGLNFVPVVGPILSSLVGPVASLFDRTQQRSEETARDSYRDAVYAGMAQIKAAVDSCKITPEQGRQAGRELIDNMYRACDTFTKASVAKSCRNFETQDVPGGPQEGAFATRLTQIAQGGANCRGGETATGGTASASSVPASGLAASLSSSNLPQLLLLAGGAYLLLKVLK